MRDAKAAERARRYRRHRQGDHSLCLIGNCSAVTAVTVTENVTLELPVTRAEPAEDVPGLGERGKRLWDDVTAVWRPPAMHREMLLEACRMADRLEKLDRQLKGEDWLRFWTRDDDGSEVTVYVDKVLSEARELAGQFRMLVGDLAKVMPAAKQEKKGGGVLADLAAKRAARSSQPTG